MEEKYKRARVNTMIEEGVNIEMKRNIKGRVNTKQEGFGKQN